MTGCEEYFLKLKPFPMFPYFSPGEVKQDVDIFSEAF